MVALEDVYFLSIDGVRPDVGNYGRVAGAV